VGLFDRVRIRILKDLPETIFENGEFPNWKAGDEADASWVEDDVAYINYG
jgi:hypothetical protein